MLSGLEAIHHNPIQGMAHEMLTLGHSAREATYAAILRGNITEAEHKATMRCLHPEADAAWKKMHEVMYNHQLEYDWWLSDFLKEVEATLANMRDRIWTAINALLEGEGVTFEDCLSLALHILSLLPQIPIDVLYETQIPLIIAYCPESSVYRRWHAKHGGVSPFRKKVRASQTLTKVLGGMHHQDSEGADRAPSPTASEGSVGSNGSRGSRARHIAIPEVSPHTAAVNQVLPTPGPLKTTRNPAVDLSPPTRKRMLPVMTSMQRFVGMTLKS